ncbi:MAG: hypothetical protein ACRD2W_00560 [Acidimicrobiales bacterium]
MLGVDPRLILVFELVGPVEIEDFRRAGLRVLDGSDRHLVVAFADDPSLAGFHERLDALQGGVREGRKQEPYAGFVDAIESLRAMEPADRLTDGVREAMERADADDVLRIDVECWHPDDRDIATAWLGDLAAAVEALGGRVVDRYVHDGAGLLLARVYVKSGAVQQLAELDFIARIDVLPRPALTLPQLFGSELRDLPPAAPPLDDAPIVGIIDSGVRSAHPLLAGAVVAADAIGTGIGEGEDQHGHGTNGGRAHRTRSHRCGDSPRPAASATLPDRLGAGAGRVERVPRRRALGTRPRRRRRVVRRAGRVGDQCLAW